MAFTKKKEENSIGSLLADYAGNKSAPKPLANNTTGKISNIASGIDTVAKAAAPALSSLGSSLGAGINSYYKKKGYEEDREKAAADLSALEASKPGKYSESDALIAARKQLADKEANAPAEYVNKYADAIDEILDKVNSRGEFNYDINVDPIWNSLKDTYQRNAMLGMKNAMGEASALTGGYGSSYSQQAGQQAYQQSISEMTDIIPQLADNALARWQAGGNELRSNLAALQSQQAQDRAMYESDLAQFNTDRNYLYNKVMDMSDEEFNQYLAGMEMYYNDRDFYASQKQQAIDNLQYQEAQDESRRQFNQSLLQDYVGLAADTTLGLGSLGLDAASLASDNYWQGRNLTEDARQFDTSLAEDSRQFDASLGEDARQFDASLAEDSRQFDASLGEDARQFNASLLEDQRQYDSKLDYDNKWAQKDYEIALAKLAEDGAKITTETDRESYDDSAPLTYEDVVSYLAADYGVKPSEILTKQQFETERKNRQPWSRKYDTYEQYLEDAIKYYGGNIE